MNRDNPLSPPNPRSDFFGSEDVQQRVSKRVPTSGAAGIGAVQLFSRRALRRRTLLTCFPILLAQIPANE